MGFWNDYTDGTAKILAAKKAGLSQPPSQSQGLRCQKFGNNLNIFKFCFPGKEACRDDFESSQFLFIAQDLPLKLPQHSCSFCFCRSVFLSNGEEPWMRSKQTGLNSYWNLYALQLGLTFLPCLSLKGFTKQSAESPARPCVCSPRQMSCHLCFHQHHSSVLGLFHPATLHMSHSFLFFFLFWDRNVNWSK